MKRLSLTVILVIVSVLFSGYANAVIVNIAHPENNDIVGAAIFTNTVCFNNDGLIASVGDCGGPSAFDEGFMWLNEG